MEKAGHLSKPSHFFLKQLFYMCAVLALTSCNTSMTQV